MLRVATMMTILDNVRDRIQKCQSFGNKGAEAELRRCNTVPRPDPIPRDRIRHGEVDDDKGRLRKELTASLAAQKSLQAMCSSLGKEKEIMAAELSRKVQELSGMEELINDLKAQNETLLEKVKEKNKRGGGGVGGGESQVILALQERNKALSEQLLKALDGYRSMKRKLKAAQEESVVTRANMDEMRAKIVGSLERIRSFKERIMLSSASGDDDSLDVREEIVALESMFECFQMLVAKHDKKKGDCVRIKGEINACKPSVLA
ncbi:hypothetical protein DH2020_009088 [Rehmannia glutinosa]|uniref:Uncharacterized protein n=1 Tax=Rehmannia glutinosa TaxID=99300 RepID=A0ABR0X8Q3_REHGL